LICDEVNIWFLSLTVCSSHLYPNGSTLDWHVPLAAAASSASGAGRAAATRTAAAPTQSRIVKVVTARLLLLLLLPPDGIAGPNMLIVVLGFLQMLLDEKFLSFVLVFYTASIGCEFYFYLSVIFNDAEAYV